MLSFTGNFEFLAKDSLITDLKQNLLGKVSNLVTGSPPAAQNILFSIGGCPQANPVILSQLIMFSESIFVVRNF